MAVSAVDSYTRLTPKKVSLLGRVSGEPALMGKSSGHNKLVSGRPMGKPDSPSSLVDNCTRRSHAFLLTMPACSAACLNSQSSQA